MEEQESGLKLFTVARISLKFLIMNCFKQRPEYVGEER